MHSDLEHPALVSERLRELPVELTPPLSWPQFQQRLIVGGGARMATWRYAVLAAGLAAVVAGTALWSRLIPPDRRLNADGGQAQLPMLTMPDSQSVERAEASQVWLANLPAEPAVVRVGTRSAVADLEDRIAWVDDVLSDEGVDAVNPIHIVALQHERARLVNSLAQVRYAETLVAAAQ